MEPNKPIYRPQVVVELKIKSLIKHKWVVIKPPSLPTKAKKPSNKCVHVVWMQIAQKVGHALSKSCLVWLPVLHWTRQVPFADYLICVQFTYYLQTVS